MKTTAIKKITGLLIAASLTTGIYAQVRNDVIKAFNTGVGLMKTDIKGAIDAFENSISIAEQVGDSADDIRMKAINVLPGLYYQQTYNVLTVEKNIPSAIQSAKVTREVAEKYQNQNVIGNTDRVLVQAYSTMASEFFSKKDYQNAAYAFDSVLMVDGTNLTALNNKALIYRTLGNKEEFIKSVDAYLVQLKATNDTAKIAQAETMARDYFRAEAGKLNTAKDFNGTLELLNTASQYGEDKNVLYQLANVYNSLKNYSKAAESAKAGLALETGSAEEKAKFYWELGTAQAGLGDNGAACESYRNSSYGAFAEASKAQRTNLKCQ